MSDQDNNVETTDSQSVVKTTFVGYRDPNYRGEPKSRRMIYRLDEPILLHSRG